MADTKISALTDGGSAQIGDTFVAVRAGADVKVSLPGQQFSPVTMSTASIGASLPQYALVPKTITSLSLSTLTAPSGSGLVVEFRKNGVAFSTQTIADGTTTRQTATVSVTFAVGDVFDVRATAVGSTTAATGVVAQVA